MTTKSIKDIQPSFFSNKKEVRGEHLQFILFSI